MKRFSLKFPSALFHAIVLRLYLKGKSEQRLPADLEYCGAGMNKKLLIVVIGLLVGGCTCLLLLAFWGSDSGLLPRRIKGSARPNLILVTVECIRADRVSALGYHRETTPHTDRFFQEGVLFTNAIAPTSWTLPSMVSLFTSKYPEEHGSVRGFWHGKDHKVFQSKIAQELVTLPEELKRHGYRTFGFNTNPHLTREFGFGKGLGRFDDTLIFATARDVVRAILNRKERYTSQQPYFLWVHFFDPHWPYTAQRPWITWYEPMPPYVPPEIYEGFIDVEVRNRRLPPDHEIIRYLSDSYDSEVNFWDESLAKLYSALGQDDNTMVVVASDHGEGFHEHGHMDHGYSLNAELTHVLMAFKFPGKEHAGTRITRAVSLLDIAPTMLAAVGLPANPEFRGTNLIPIIQAAERDDTEAYVFAHLDNFDKAQRSIESDTWKLLLDFKTKEVQLFNKKDDPGETKNLVGEYPALVETLSAQLVQKTKELEINAKYDTQESEATLSDEEIARLRELGYL